MVGLSRHARRHRQSYHDDKRAGRSGLGCRWNRSGSRHARASDLSAAAGSHRRQAEKQARAGHTRDRHRACSHRKISRRRRRRRHYRVLRRRCCCTLARRPRDDFEHVARVRLDRIAFPHRREHDRVSDVDGPLGTTTGPRRGVCEGAGTLGRHASTCEIRSHARARSELGYPCDRRTEGSPSARSDCGPEVERDRIGVECAGDFSRRWRSGYRSDHELHQHVQPAP